MKQKFPPCSKAWCHFNILSTRATIYIQDIARSSKVEKDVTKSIIRTVTVKYASKKKRLQNQRYKQGKVVSVNRIKIHTTQQFNWRKKARP